MDSYKSVFILEGVNCYKITIHRLLIMSNHFLVHFSKQEAGMFPASFRATIRKDFPRSENYEKQGSTLLLARSSQKNTNFRSN